MNIPSFSMNANHFRVDYANGSAIELHHDEDTRWISMVILAVDKQGRRLPGQSVRVELEKDRE